MQPPLSDTLVALYTTNSSIRNESPLRLDDIPLARNYTIKCKKKGPFHGVGLKKVFWINVMWVRLPVDLWLTNHDPCIALNMSFHDFVCLSVSPSGLGDSSQLRQNEELLLDAL